LSQNASPRLIVLLYSTKSVDSITAKMTEEKGTDFVHVFGLCRELLQRLTNKEAADALKALGALHNLKVVSAYAPTGNPLLPPPSRDTRGQVKPRVIPKGDPKIKEIRSKIKILNKQISEKSDLTGGRLPLEDDLIDQRNQLFRCLKEAKNCLAGAAEGGYPEGA
jgi:hypothetical protein